MLKNGGTMNSYNQIKKFNVVGTSGSGKSTLSKKIAAKIGGRYIGLDELHWGPNWTSRPDEELFSKLENALDCETWVVDGNYHRTAPIKWKEVEAVVWVDLPFWLTVYQALMRAIKRTASGKEIWPGTGNVESFSRTFLSRESVLLWTITSYKRVKKRYLELIEDPAYNHIKFIRLRSRKEVRNFLHTL
jgi:adenylate kinase family enzyme